MHFKCHMEMCEIDRFLSENWTKKKNIYIIPIIYNKFIESDERQFIEIVMYCFIINDNWTITFIL
jgi:hypothetical protein